jgi:hypothetical protein
MRHVRANFVSRLSRTPTARAIVSIGRLARARIAWTSGTEAEAKEAAQGIRLTR